MNVNHFLACTSILNNWFQCTKVRSVESVKATRLWTHHAEVGKLKQSNTVTWHPLTKYLSLDNIIRLWAFFLFCLILLSFHAHAKPACVFLQFKNEKFWKPVYHRQSHYISQTHNFFGWPDITRPAWPWFIHKTTSRGYYRFVRHKFKISIQ